MSQLNFLQFYKKLLGKYIETTKNPRSSVVARTFQRGGGGHNFHIFFKRILFGGTNLKLIKKQ